jgi:hypothetical protein
MTVSAGDLTLLRGKNHRASIYASILKPITLWSAQINGSVGLGTTTIPYDNASGLDFTAVVPLQEVWVGTVAGADDIGRLRIRSIVAGNLTVARHGLRLADNQYLTFKHDYPLKPLYPLIGGDGTFYKDGDITYTDQNEWLKPTVIAGGHRGGFIDEDLGYFEVISELPNSYTIMPGATISSYGASVYPTTGVTISINAGTGVGNIRFAEAGQFWVKYTVTDSYGKSQSSYRFYYAHDKADHAPLTSFTVNSLNWDWGRGGWTSGIKVHGDSSGIPDKTICVLWQEAYYGSVKKNITLLPNESNTILCGYLRKNDIEYNIENGMGEVDFLIETIDGILRNQYMFSVSLEARPGVTTWYEYRSNLSVRNAIDHLWRYHSTLFEVCDIFLGNGTDGRAYAELEDGSLHSMADDLAGQRGDRTHVVCDKAGRIHILPEIQLLTDAERVAISTVQTITKEDRSGSITIIEQKPNRTAFVKVSGFLFSGTFSDPVCPDPFELTPLCCPNPPCPDVEPYCSSAPAQLPADDGLAVTNFDRQVLRSQLHCDQIAGRILAMQNNPYPEVRVDFHGNYLGVLDAVNKFWQISVAHTDSTRKIVWENKNLICRNITGSVDVSKGIINCKVVFEPEVAGFTGVAGYCMDELPSSGGDDGELPDPDTTPTDTYIDGAVITGSSVRYLAPLATSWDLRSEDAVNDIGQDPFWRSGKTNSIFPGSAIVYRMGNGNMYMGQLAGQMWTDITPEGSPPNDSGDDPAPDFSDLDYILYEGDMVAVNHHYVAATRQVGSQWRSWLYKTTVDFGTGDLVQLGEAIP